MYSMNNLILSIPTLFGVLISLIYGPMMVLCILQVSWIFSPVKLSPRLFLTQWKSLALSTLLKKLRQDARLMSLLCFIQTVVANMSLKPIGRLQRSSNLVTVIKAIPTTMPVLKPFIILVRSHSHCDYMSPDQYERAYVETVALTTSTCAS